MKSQTYLMSFERMLRILQENGINIERSLVMRMTSPPSRLVCNGQAVVLSNDLCEKFLGTWWEVELAGDDEIPSRCFYIADSLQDALRLRPHIDTSYWCDYAENSRQFVSEIANWQEDEVFWE